MAVASHWDAEPSAETRDARILGVTLLVLGTIPYIATWLSVLDGDDRKQVNSKLSSSREACGAEDVEGMDVQLSFGDDAIVPRIRGTSDSDGWVRFRISPRQFDLSNAALIAYATSELRTNTEHLEWDLNLFLNGKATGLKSAELRKIRAMPALKQARDALRKAWASLPNEEACE